MLDELIQLYVTLNLMDEEEIFYLKRIHSFQCRDIGSWNDVQDCVQFFCYLLEWIIFHLPDIPVYEDY